MLSAYNKHRFLILLGVLILLFLSAPFIGRWGLVADPLVARIIFIILFVATLLTALFAVCQKRRTIIIAGIFVVAAIAMRGINFISESKLILTLSQLLSVLFLVYTVVIILTYLFKSKRVTTSTIHASLCGYLIMGVLWASLYTLIEIFEPGSFSFSFVDENNGGFMQFGSEHSFYALYYSLVTLTTLGYGDIVPATAPARMFAAIEAVMGQIYIAVIVARLVGIQVAQSFEGKNEEGSKQ